MLSLHYTHNFFNFRKACKIYFAMDKPADTSTSETPSNKAAITSEVNVDGLEYISGAPLTQWVSEKHVIPSTIGLAMGAGKKELLGMVQMPKCHYSSVQAVCDDIVSKFDRLFFQRYKLKLIVTRKNSGLITLSLSNGATLTLHTDNSNIATILGLPCTEVVQDRVDSRMERSTTMYSLTPVGTEIPRLDTLHALYVYADVVEPQHVGDTMAPLIGYADIRGKPGDRISHTCNPPVYLPVAKSYIDAIRVRITDERGDNVMFPDLLENVVVRLHFRKAKSVSFF
jgi:hypothetical protein